MKKGFTLIELLAVIVILAIIALIATPIVLNIIQESRENANIRSIDMYAKAVENAVALYRTSGTKITGDFTTEDGKILTNLIDLNIKLNVDYNGNVVCNTIKIRKDQTLTLANCKVNGEEVNYIYGVVTLGEHIIYNNGGYSKAIDLKGEKKIVTTNAQLSSSTTLYFSDEIEIDYEKGIFKLVGNVQQKKFSDECTYDYNCSNVGTYGAPSIESSYVYKDFSYAIHLYYLEPVNATKMSFDYEYNSKAGTGLYKTEDSLGDSYYFRGDVKNNYLVLANKKIFEKADPYIPVDVVDASTACGEDAECIKNFSIISKFMFSSKETCEEFGGGEVWTTCAVTDIKEVYYLADFYEPFFFETEEECVNASNLLGVSVTGCDKRKLDKTEEKYINRGYYRIVRINGDGTIRLIYDGDKLVENGEEHTATITDSLTTWYQRNIVNHSFDKYIAETNFQNNVGEKIWNSHDVWWEGNSGHGIGEWYNIDYYITKNPDLKQGTTELKNVGLLSAPEAALAGTLGPISNNYLSGSSFITSTLSRGSDYVGTCYQICCEQGSCYSCYPYSCVKSAYYYYIVSKDGSLTTAETGTKRPVINLIEDVQFTGSGTIDDPYVVIVEI